LDFVVHGQESRVSAVTFLFEQTGFDIRAVEAATAVASAREDRVLAAFQDQAILLFARADTEMIPHGDVSRNSEEAASIVFGAVLDRIIEGRS
jgi:hypothetical protein